MKAQKTIIVLLLFMLGATSTALADQFKLSEVELIEGWASPRFSYRNTDGADRISLSGGIGFRYDNNYGFLTGYTSLSWIHNDGGDNLQWKFDVRGIEGLRFPINNGRVNLGPAIACAYSLYRNRHMFAECGLGLGVSAVWLNQNEKGAYRQAQLSASLIADYWWLKMDSEQGITPFGFGLIWDFAEPVVEGWVPRILISGDYVFDNQVRISAGLELMGIPVGFLKAVDLTTALSVPLTDYLALDISYQLFWMNEPQGENPTISDGFDLYPIKLSELTHRTNLGLRFRF